MGHLKGLILRRHSILWSLSILQLQQLALIVVWSAMCSSFASAVDSNETSRLPNTKTLSTINYNDINDPEVSLMGYMAFPPSLAYIQIDTYIATNATFNDDDKGDIENENGDDQVKVDSDTSSVLLVPAVVILPDWNNVNDYEITRARMIAQELGYIAFTADIYGSDLHDVQDFNQKIELATLYRSNHTLFNSRIASAIATVRNQPYVDPNRVALIGYCLGGTGVLTYSFANTNVNTSDVVAAVSFHGGLMDFEVDDQSRMVNPILILSGGEDDAGTDVEDLEKRLVAAGATWQITRYSGIRHGFTVFGSDAYNEWVDKRSWAEMTTFLQERFGEIGYGAVGPSEDDVNATIVSYVDSSGYELEGVLAMPEIPNNSTKLLPAVLILPNWDGTSGPFGYEARRARMVANEGNYVAMVGDIFGKDLSIVESFRERVLQLELYRTNPDLFVQRIQAGVDQLMQHPAVDTSNIFIAGYCFGGTGSIDYAFSANSLENVRAVVPIHGGLNPLQAIKTDNVKPYVLVLSGGVDDAHGDPTKLELHLDKANASWEISRYSDTYHSFTVWEKDAYNPMADSRSWWSMMSLFESIINGDEFRDNKMKDNVGSSTITIIEEEEGESLKDDVDYFDSSAHGRSFESALLAIVSVLLLSIASH